jgi:MFS family permease
MGYGMENKENRRFVALLVWCCITFFYCYQYILRIIPNIIMPSIMSKYSVGATEYGSFAGIYYIGYVLVHIPIGILLTRFGAKKILPICIILTAVGITPLVYFDSWNSVIIGRLLTGIGSSAAIVGALQIFRILYPQNFARMLGIMVSLSLITVVYSGKPLSIVVASIGISSTINILLISGVVLAALTYFLLPKSASESSHSELVTDIKAIVCNYKLIFASLFAGLMVGPLEGFADAWGSAFLVSVYGFNKVAADSTVLSILFGMCIGCIILPYIADKTKLYFGTTIFSGLAMIVLFIYLLQGSASVSSIYYTCLIIGFFCAYQVIIIAKISTFVSEERSGMAGAVVNMIVMAFGWVFHNSIGLTLDKLWTGELQNEIKVYSPEAFIKAISIIPIATCLAIIGLSIMAMINIIRAAKLKR